MSFHRPLLSPATEIVEPIAWRQGAQPLAFSRLLRLDSILTLPSLVIKTSPMSSTIILSSPCGPNELFTMLATAEAAVTEIMSVSYHYWSGHLDPDHVLLRSLR
jgi:hypothetical protein